MANARRVMKTIDRSADYWTIDKTDEFVRKCRLACGIHTIDCNTSRVWAFNRDDAAGEFSQQFRAFHTLATSNLTFQEVGVITIEAHV